MTTTLFSGEIMTHEGQSREDALEPNRPLVHPITIMKIGNWNVRASYRGWNIAQAGREITNRGIDIMRISDHLEAYGTEKKRSGLEILD